MTEERKRELAQLLEEAMGQLMVRCGYAPSSIPPVVYQRYLEEHWTYYGVDFLSFMFSIRLELDVVSEATKSNLLNFIREELALFIDEWNIPIGSYRIENNPTNESHLFSLGYQRLALRLLIERLLQISLVRGIEEAVSVLDRCSCPEGTHDLFQDVMLLKGIKLDTEIEVFEGVRLVPLPSSDKSSEVIRYLPGFPDHSFIDQMDLFFGRTLLVIDRPGLSIFHEPAPNPTFPQGHPVDNLSFQVEKYNAKFLNSKEADSFKRHFCQALSLVCNSPVQIVTGGWFLQEDKSFHPHNGLFNVLRHFNLSGSSYEAGESDIEKAICLYQKFFDLDADGREKLMIPIDRWVESQTNRNSIDKIIDLGIAFEALYLSDLDETTELSFRLRLRAAWYLGQNKEHRRALMKEFSEIYNWRSKVVHTGKLPNKTKKTPFTPEEVDKFIKRAQKLCRKSILKILKKKQFPDWNSLILGGEDEQASS